MKQQSVPSDPGTAVGERRDLERRCPDWLMCSHGSVLDISRDGLRLLCTRRLKGVQEVRLWDNSEGVDVVAEAMWTKRLGFRRHEIGLRLLGLDPAVADRFDELGSGASFRDAG